jgi:hypothetical protein
VSGLFHDLKYPLSTLHKVKNCSFNGNLIDCIKTGYVHKMNTTARISPKTIAPWSDMYVAFPETNTPLIRRWIYDGSIRKARPVAHTTYKVTGLDSAQFGRIEFVFAKGKAPDAMIRVLLMSDGFVRSC